MSPYAVSDGNVAFTLTPPQRQRVMRTLDKIVYGLPQASSILIDRSGRIVEVARRPVGVELPAISALAAGCYATTHELANAMGEKEYSLLFQHEDDQQVYIWAVGDRALLVVLLRGASSADTLEEHLAQGLGSELTAIVREANEPAMSAPPPRVEAAVIPQEVREKTRTLTAVIMDLQANLPGKFTPRVNSALLHSREQLVKAICRQDWRAAIEICEATRKSMIRFMHLSAGKDPGGVVIELYSGIIGVLHDMIAREVPAGRLNALYVIFFKSLGKKWPQIFADPALVSAGGLDVPALWRAASVRIPDSLHCAREFSAAMDAFVRDLLRVVNLVKGIQGRQIALQEASRILARHSADLLPLGLEGVAGRDWILAASTE